MDAIKKVAKTILLAVVDKEDIEQIDLTDEGEYVKLTIKVVPDAIGKLIGKEGKVVKAIRTLLKIVTYRELDKKLTVDIIKPE